MHHVYFKREVLVVNAMLARGVHVELLECELLSAKCRGSSDDCLERCAKVLEEI